MASTIRTFVAIELQQKPAQAAKRILSTLNHAVDEFRWVDGENLHLTLKFLGDVPESEIPDVCRVVGQAAASHEPFHMTVGTLGAFPSVDRPRVVWLGVTGGAEKLTELQLNVEQNLLELGFDRERNSYHPHVTLGRLRRDRRFSEKTSSFIASHKNVVAGESAVSEVIVFASYLDRHGPTYTPMSRCPLRVMH